MSKLALLLPELEAGGAQRVMLCLAEQFNGMGHRVKLVLLSASGPLRESIPPGVEVVDLDAPAGAGSLRLAVASIWRLRSWLRAERPDAVLSTVTGANLTAILARTLSRCRTRLVIRQAITLANDLSSGRRRAIKLLYPIADRIVVLSDAMRTDLQAIAPVPRSRISVIPNPVDVPFLLDRARQPVDHPWLSAGGPRLVMTSGRLIPQKDHASLLRAFALLPRSLHARLIIIGEGPERPALGALAASLGIADRVDLPGFDPNPWRWLARAHVFALSSRWEGNPNALLEALALGLPAVTTEFDASVHGLNHAGGLLITPPGDPGALADAIALQMTRGEAGRLPPGHDPAHVAHSYLRALALI